MVEYLSGYFEVYEVYDCPSVHKSRWNTQNRWDPFPLEYNIVIWKPAAMLSRWISNKFSMQVVEGGGWCNHQTIRTLSWTLTDMLNLIRNRPLTYITSVRSLTSFRVIKKDKSQIDLKKMNERFVERLLKVSFFLKRIPNHFTNHFQNQQKTHVGHIQELKLSYGNQLNNLETRLQEQKTYHHKEINNINENFEEKIVSL